MNRDEIVTLGRGLAPVIRDLVAAAVLPFQARIDDLQRQLSERDALPALVNAAVGEAVAAIRVPADGQNGLPGQDGKDGAPGINGRDGVDGAPGERGLDGAPGRDGDPGQDGRDGEHGEAGLPGADGRNGIDGKDGAPGRDGVDGAAGRDGLDGAAGRDGVDGRDGAPGERGEKGDAGPPGALPVAKDWSDGVHYQSDVVAHAGALWQATKDTAKEPPHDDWQCLARAGQDGRSFAIRGTWSENSEYGALDVVMLNGASFVAKKDDPGLCPGDGWQLLASQGKTGKPGEQGKKGDPGPRGERGPAVAAAHIDDMGLLTLVNADGSTVQCDLYPLLTRVAG